MNRIGMTVVIYSLSYTRDQRRLVHLLSAGSQQSESLMSQRKTPPGAGTGTLVMEPVLLATVANSSNVFTVTGEVAA